MEESDRRHSWLVKVLIVMMVFPTFLLTLMQVWKLVLYPLAWLLPAEGLWAQLIGWSAAVVGVVFALVGALWICRLIWPKRATNSHA
jgi:membrane associated rhomboid family serine protease